jgi:hypothetical protein
MKTILMRRYASRFGALVLCCAALSAAPMLAQTDGGVHGVRSPQVQLNALTRQLALTPGQVPRIKAILVDTAKKLTEVLNAGGSSADLRSKMIAIRMNQRTTIEASLTDDQKVKYEATVQ